MLFCIYVLMKLLESYCSEIFKPTLWPLAVWGLAREDIDQLFSSCFESTFLLLVLAFNF